MTEIRIGRTSEEVTIRLRDSEKPDPEGWVNADVALKMHAWSGLFAAQFLEDDFGVFAQDLRRLSDGLAPPAQLFSTDGYLEITLTRDELGHVDVTGEAWDTPRWGAHLEFSFQIDQTYLPPILSSVESVLEQFRRAV